MTSHPPAPLATTRAALATAAFDLTGEPPLDPHLGPITLHPHQQVAAARLRRALHTHGGALLADAVGLGKTWVALTLLRDAHTPVVIAPAALRRMWLDRAAVAHVPLAFHSTETLSAPPAPTFPSRPDLVVVDEAHHFRTPTTRRRARLAALCTHAPVLLLSATPVHNTAHDLTALLALFLGEHAATLDPRTLAHLVVRRRHRDVRLPTGSTPAASPHLPAVAPTLWHAVPAPLTVWRALRALPPPVPPADGGHAPALATLTLARLWVSSDAALRAALRRRLARATALAYALAAGRHPDRRTLATWATHDDVLQLPLFLDDTLLDGSAPPDAEILARHVDAHAAALRDTLATLDTAPPADPARIAWLQAVRAQHPDARVVAFTQFADTARAVFRAIAPHGHAGLLTADGGRIASGPLARESLIARFAPHATGAPDPTPIERVDCLIATDCLSEGLDLRDASVVVHLDLPWTPARLAQRVGRTTRLGAPHTTVHVYALRPAPHVARWLRLARRLRAKARATRHTLGIRPAPPVAGADSTDTDNAHTGVDRGRRLAQYVAAHRQLEHWLGDHAPHPPPTVAAVRCGHSGFVAVYRLTDQATSPVVPTLLAALDGRPPSAAPRLAVRALRHLARANITAVAPMPNEVAAARAAIRAWLRRHAALSAVGVGPRPALERANSRQHPGVRAALARADAALRAAPPHARASRAAAVTTLRDALGRPMSAGTEQAVAELDATAGHDAWLAAALAATVPSTVRAGPAPVDPAPAVGASPSRITALVLLVP